VQSAELDGHVVLFEQPVARRGAQQQPSLRATAGKAVYEGVGEWLHLTGSARAGDGPRIVNGGLELTAEKVDVSRQSGEAFAHGNVKATWAGGQNPGGNQSGAGQGGGALGGNGPAHAIASDAQLNQSTGIAVFRGHARLWQQANSIAAPEIVLNQHLQSLTATTADAADPVRAVLVSAGAPDAAIAHGQSALPGTAKNSAASVIRVRGGDLEYSDTGHRALMRGGVADAVVAETGTATSSSDRVDLRMIPAGAGSGGPAQVDRLTATGHVVLTAQGRRGTGEQLVYSGITGDYVLTGAQGAPPRISDSAQGSVSGEALIFHSRDDSVSIEGGGHETRTETTAPAAHGR
jgi:lipopolysaccharide export system protein LptA